MSGDDKMVKNININKKLFGLLYPDGKITFYKVLNGTRREEYHCHVNDEVNAFPYTDKDSIILKAREI